MYCAGIDVGSTTVKLVLFDENFNLLFSRYERHFSDVKSATLKVIQEAVSEIGDLYVRISITGSAGISLSDAAKIPFVQEVIAATAAVEKFIPQTDVVIELGGEDAKITFLGEVLEQRMNGTCAGGTGAFIDQMAELLKTDTGGVNELAKHYSTLYPIASRCGVFAKTDIQPLINEGAAREDIAVSIFQAVVNQTIAGLAAGRKILGKVAFLGGPLYFMSELRKRFIETLGISEEDVILPDNPQLFVAMGAALDEHQAEYKLSQIIRNLDDNGSRTLVPKNTLQPLFTSDTELEVFYARHNLHQADYRELSAAKGALFLGIDAGSTTSKVILSDTEGNILFSHYGNNKGQPLESVAEIIKEIYQKMPDAAFIAKSCITGYGEHLIKEALRIDYGEVETMAHYKAANHFYPGVDFILDIGGQDMKSIRIQDGALSSIQLNEACSSGCGSFIETFAKSLQCEVQDFAKAALRAENPVDLGSKCTVFMNSKVKQVQKEGASLADISAGLSYSVIKNALYKVIKMKRPQDLGEKIVVQGGTFYNDSVLRAFEIISGREVVRPNIAGLMGAYGCALIAKEKYEDETTPSAMMQAEELQNFSVSKEFSRCGLCENHCALTINVFSNGAKFVSGNRCERGAEYITKTKSPKKEKRENLVQYKYARLFNFPSLSESEAKFGTMGLPRVLNMYENYPLWHTILTDLGFRVQLSPKSDKNLYESGIDTIPSDTVCYPAKISHGHIQALLDAKVDAIFYPSVIFEQIENSKAANHFNCPVVQSYPEVIAKNIDAIRNREVPYFHPFVNLADPEGLAKILYKEFSSYGIKPAQVRSAVEHGFAVLAALKQDLKHKAQALLQHIAEHGEKAIVLSGRPYHLDPEINHGIANIITQEGFHVLTEDMLAACEGMDGLRVVDQWVYHARLYAAAKAVVQNPNLELVQLNSFGCGLDAVTTDQVEEIMRDAGKLYTVLKIDEGGNLGAVRIRLRSLKAAVAERAQKAGRHPAKIIPLHPEPVQQPVFTKDMKAKHTLLMPILSPIHQNGLIGQAFTESGYNVVVLPSMDKSAIDVGLKYVNNDACYPAIISIGQLVSALESGQYDPNRTSVMMTQTGGGCRATNYIPLLRKALKDAGFAQVPVISISMGNKGVEDTPGFQLSFPFIKRLFIAVMYGDLFERVLYRVRPYEAVPGSANALYEKWLALASENVKSGSYFAFNRNMKRIIRDFDRLPTLHFGTKPRVGVVGEILVKYSPTANNDIVGIIESEGGEAVVPDLIGFMNYSFFNQIWKADELHMSKKAKNISKLAIDIIQLLERPMNKALEQSERFEGIDSIYEIADKASQVISIGNHTGEGWFLTGEMIALLNKNINNIICLQPFGCLPNHVVGKGMMKELRRQYKNANIAAIDYDPGSSEVNQLNRIRLMMSTAKKAQI